MLLPLLLDHNCQHIIASLGQGGPSRFSKIQKRTELDNKTLSSKLKELRDAMVVVARTIPSKGDRIWLEYRLTPRGEAMYGVLQDLRDSLQKRKKALGPAVEQFEEVFEAHAAVA